MKSHNPRTKGDGTKYLEVVRLLKELPDRRAIAKEIAYQANCSSAYVHMIKTGQRPGQPKAGIS